MRPQDTTTGSVSARVINAGLWVFGSQLLSLALVFIAQRLVLIGLEPESNGILFLDRRLTEVIIGLLADFGINGIVVRRVAQQPHRAAEILSSAFYARLGLWSACTLTAAVAGWVSAVGITDVILWNVYMLIASRGAMLRYTLETRLRAVSDFRLPSLLAVMDATLFAALIILWRDQLTPSVVIHAFVISAVPGFVLLLLIDRGRSTSWSSSSGDEMRSILREALPVVASTLLIAVHDKVDAFIVRFFSGFSQVGVLAATYTTLGPLLAVIPMAVSYAAMPDVAGLIPIDRAKGLDVAAGVMKHLLVISLVVTSAATVVMPLFVEIVTGGRYAGALDQFVWFVWSAPFVALLVYAQELSVVVERQGNLLRIALTLMVCTVGFGLLLIPSMQSLGAVVAKIITSFAGAGVSLWLLHATLGGRIGLGFGLRCLLLTLISCALAVTLMSSASSAGLEWSSVPTLLWRLVVVTIAIPLAALAVGILDGRDIRRLRNGFAGT